MADAEQALSDVQIPADAPRDWKLDAVTNELIFPIAYVVGSEAVAQRLRVGLRLIRGEVFFDKDAGFPWLENDTVSAADAVLGDRVPDQAAVEARARRFMLATTGVARIVSLSSSIDTEERLLDLTAVIVTVYGDEITVSTSKDLGA